MPDTLAGEPYALSADTVASLTAMGYHGKWRSTEASPTRAVDAGLLDRFGSIDPTDGGVTSRYAAAAEWQHGTALDDSVYRVAANIPMNGVRFDAEAFVRELRLGTAA